jgi:tRNA G10  N-methylase Trm11
MVRLAQVQPQQLLLDPMCGVGTILAERLLADRRARVIGGDLEELAVLAAQDNLRHLGEAWLARWDARQLPLADQSIPCVASNPPFGKQLGEPEDIGMLYAELVYEIDRVLQPGGRAVLLVSDVAALARATRAVSWNRLEQLRLRILGQPAMLTVWKKG